MSGTTHVAGPYTGGLDKIHLKTERESGAVFYRTKWSGAISFAGVDFTRFYEIFRAACCHTVGLDLYRAGCVTTTPQTPYWRGIFNVSDLSFDVSAGTATLTTDPRPNDGYETLLTYWEDEQNWMELPSEVSVYSADKAKLYTRGRYLITLLAGMVRLTLQNTEAASLIAVPEADMVSQFIEAPTNPVTGRANQFYKAVCIQAADFLKPSPVLSFGHKTPTYSVRAKLSLKELADDLAALCNLYPHIDPATGKLRWEHLSYYPYLSYSAPAVVYSLPAEHESWHGNQAIETDQSGTYRVYTLSIGPDQALFREADQVLYTGDSANPTIKVDQSDLSSIRFTDACTANASTGKPQTNTRRVLKLTTDVGRLNANPTAVEKADWIVLLHTADTVAPAGQVLIGDTRQIATGDLKLFGLYSVGIGENVNMNAPALLVDFHRHRQPVASGVLFQLPFVSPKGVTYGMLSLTPNRTLNAVSIPYCCTDSPVPLAGLVQTWYGDNGEVLSADYHVAAEQLTLQIAHPGPCITSDTVTLPPAPGQPCPARGVYLRTEKDFKFDFTAGLELVCHLINIDVFTDGKCGEYKVTSPLYSGSC